VPAALADLAPDAEILRLIHPLSGEATRLAFQWRHQVLTGSRGGERRERWRQRAADGALPWGLLATWLARENEEDADPTPRRADRSHCTLSCGWARCAWGCCWWSRRPRHRSHPRTRLLALRLMLSPPGWGPVVLQIELGATGPGADQACICAWRPPTRGADAAAAAAAATGRPDHPAGPEPGRRSAGTAATGHGPVDTASRPRAAARLPPLLFRVATELCLALWADETPAATPPASAQ
jgi:hypothetical protein